MTDNGFIKLHKKLLKWEWYDDVNTCRLFIHCLLKANWQTTNWHGIEIEEGQFVTSLANLAKETHLSVKQVRVALEHLKRTGEVAIKGQSKYSVITVNSWSEYQEKGKQNGKQGANKGQTKGKQRATDKDSINNTSFNNIEEEKEDKEIKNIFIKPTLDEVRAYCNERQNGINPEQFVDYYESKGWLVGKTKMKDWKAAVRTWENNRKGDNVNEQPKGRTTGDYWSNAGYKSEEEFLEAARRWAEDDE